MIVSKELKIIEEHGSFRVYHTYTKGGDHLTYIDVYDCHSREAAEVLIRCIRKPQETSESKSIADLQELRELCELTVKLTELRQKECGHLAIENYAPDLLFSLLSSLRNHKEGLVRVNYDTISGGSE